MSRRGDAGRAALASLRRELPWLVLAVALLVVLLHANAPEVWFWFGVLLVLLLWRSLACRGRWRRGRGLAAAEEPQA